MHRDYYTSSQSWLTSAVRVLDSSGFDGRRALAGSGIPVEDFENEAGRAPVKVIGDAWRFVASALDDPAIGVRAAIEGFNPAHWQSLGLAFLCSTTLRQALERLVKYFEVLSDAADTRLVQEQQRLSFVAVTQQDPELIGYEALEFGLAALLVLMQEVFPRPLRPVEVRLHRPQALANDDFAKLLGQNVIFGSAFESISFDIKAVDETLPSSNQSLAAYQDLFSEDYVARFGNNSVSIEVRKQILRLMPAGESSIQNVAAAVHSTARSLQRKLGSEQTSFNNLLTGTRKQLSLTYIKQPQHGISEIAYLLGFANHSSFSRAFKQWFDVTPTDYRKNIILNDGSRTTFALNSAA